MTDKNKHIPQGYKDSPLGIIPKEWEVKRLGEFAPLQRGFDLPTDKIVRGEYPVIYSNGILNYHYEYKAKGPGVVTGRSGTIGKVTFVESNYWPHNTSLWVTDFKENNPKYVFHLYSYINLSKFASGSGVPTLNRNDVHASKFAIPPIHEQDKIVEVLDFWDTAIEKQSELIEKLKLRKRALMQQLLTGKKRLPGFNGEWKKVKLGSIAEIVGGGTPNTNISHYWNGGIPWFTPTEIGKTKYVSESKKTISAHGQNNSSAKILPKGTILFTSRATIGAKAILTVEATTNQGFQSLIVHNNNNNEFIYYYLDIILKNIKQKASGSTFTEISAESMRRTEIIIPPKEEQNAIVSIFVNADKEIELANEKLASLQSQKRGLMQQLLTGKKRVSI